MVFERSSGILLHPTSFPGRYGIGDLGSEAYQFIDYLVECQQRLWQVLPLGPTGYGDSPYQCFSAFAGNPLLISPEKLVNDNLLNKKDLMDVPRFPLDTVDFGPVIEYKIKLLWLSFEMFIHSAPAAIHSEFDTFCDQEKNWLDDYALFRALKDFYKGDIWPHWDADLVARKATALKKARTRFSQEILFHKYQQFLFFRQWLELKKYANDRDIKIIGDIPIFVAHDSSDVWARPDLYFLDDKGYPTVVAGVPPDYFSETGQLWGNPLYRWDVMKREGYRWWIERFKATLTQVDYIRVDHFRGFSGYWEIPAAETTAVNGRWVQGPGDDLFYAVEKELGKLPIIAEDLGIITEDVVALRDKFGFPGMKILQFAFSSDPTNVDLPHNFVPHCVVYTGTHDNDTTVGWYSGSSTPEERDYARRYLAIDGWQINWDLIRLALASVAVFAVVPMQDLLGLGTEARMNFPSKPSGYWRWRYRPESLSEYVTNRLKELSWLYRRTKDDGSTALS